MPDIFGKRQDYVPMDFTTSDLMILRVGVIEPGDEYLVQNIAFQYNQPLNRLYEIGSAKVFFANGRPIGTMQLGRIIGQKHITELLGKTGQGVWSTDLSKGNASARTIIFKKRGGQNRGAQIQFVMTGAVVESYGYATDANGLLSQENVSLQFGGMAFGFDSNNEISDQNSLGALGSGTIGGATLINPRPGTA